GDVEVQVERRVLAVTQLDHAGHAHEVDARAEVEAADDRRARQDQDRELLVALDQRVRDRAATAQVAEAEGVMAVNEYAAILALRSHTAPSPFVTLFSAQIPCRARQALQAPQGRHCSASRTGRRHDHVSSTSSRGNVAASSRLVEW